MASSKDRRGSVPFSEATKVEKLDSHTYRVNLSEAYCIAAVPNGGYSASCMLAAAREHLSSRNQPDVLTAHFEFPHRTSAGPAIVKIDDIKLSGQGQLSTLHLTLIQDGLLPHAPWFTDSVSRRTILAYTTHTNLRTFEGITLPTGYESSPASRLPSPLPDFELLKTKGSDEAWEAQKLPPGSSIVRSLRNWHFYLPKGGEPLTPGVLDMWIRLASGERITQSTLPYVIDSFPYNMNMFLAAPEVREMLLGPRKASAEDKAKAKEAKDEMDGQRANVWLPTVVMNMEAKMALPEEGVDFLSVRVTSKQIRDGKFDLDVLVRDEDGEIVALSYHTAMILSIERNTAKKRPKAAL